MKISKPIRLLIGALIVVLICVSTYLYQWKIGSDRAGCLLNMRNMYVNIYSYAGMEGIGSNQTIPGGIRGLLKRRGISSLPVCPSGGSYSFANEASYTADGVNDIKDNVRCSHADDLGHVFPNEKR